MELKLRLKPQEVVYTDMPSLRTAFAAFRLSYLNTYELKKLRCKQTDTKVIAYVNLYNQVRLFRYEIYKRGKYRGHNHKYVFRYYDVDLDALAYTFCNIDNRFGKIILKKLEK